MTLLKIDYRFKEIFPGGSQDDSSYYYHTTTLAIDFDLNYTNQLNGNYRDAFIRNDGNPVPRQAFGPGLLSAPFLMLSNTISSFVNIRSNTSLNYFVYSFIASIYLLTAIQLIKKAVNLTKSKHYLLNLLIILGSGVTYYAFERFSMSTVYEFFSASFILFLSKKILSVQDRKVQNFYIMFLPICQFVLLTNRWNNLHFFIVPFIIFFYYKKPINIITKNIFYYLGIFIGATIFLIHTKLLYGIYTFSQQSIYPTTNWLVYERMQSFYNPDLIIENLIKAFKYFLTTLFSFEFGIFYFSPIIFLSIFVVFYFLLRRDYKILVSLVLFYIIPFLPILVFENHGTSYGFRYLFTLIPINIFFYFKLFQSHKTVSYYLLFFSVFGIFSQLFFETTQFSRCQKRQL